MNKPLTAVLFKSTLTNLRNGVTWWLLLLPFVFAVFILSLTRPAIAQMGEEPLPDLFVDTFLVLPEDAQEAREQGKYLLLYFGQPGCPYCKLLTETNFAQKDIVDKTNKNFLPLAINIFGSREVEWFDNKQYNEKTLARHLGVQFTPTILLMDSEKVLARINGYYQPHRFSAALDFVIQKKFNEQSFENYMLGIPKKGANAKLHKQDFFVKPPYNLQRKPGKKPLAVIFETRYCANCDEMHEDGFKSEKIKALLKQFDVAQFDLHSNSKLTTPLGQETVAKEWARKLKISYTPSIVFFDAKNGKEIIRLESYIRPFHLGSSFTYVASGAYKTEPEFQRFIQSRIRSEGGLETQ